MEITASPTNQQTRTLYFDILRIVATFAVIFLHTSAGAWDMENFNFDWNIRNIYDSAVRWCVPVFVMISGALFLNPEKPISIKKLYTKNIVRIITAFLIWSTIYSLYDYILSGHNSTHILGHIRNIFHGPFHFWFLFMIVGLYISTPILRFIAEKKSTTQYFLIIAFIYTFLTPFFFNTVSQILPGISSKSEEITSLLNYYYESFDLKLFAGYSGYFLLGHYLNTNNVKRLKLIYLIGVVSFVLIVMGSIISYYIYGALNNPLYGYLTPLVLFEAIAVFLFIKNLTPKIKLSIKTTNIIAKISNLCFGIYIIHNIVLWTLSYFGLRTTSFNIIISVPVISILVFVISLLISGCLYKIPFCRKYMM